MLANGRLCLLEGEPTWSHIVNKSVVFCRWLVYFSKMFQLTLKPSSVETTCCYVWFKSFLKIETLHMLYSCMCMTWEHFKCVLSTCRLLGWPRDHSQHSGLLQTSKLLQKTTDGKVPHVRRLQRFPNPCDDDYVIYWLQLLSFKGVTYLVYNMNFCFPKLKQTKTFSTWIVILKHFSLNKVQTLLLPVISSLTFNQGERVNSAGIDSFTLFVCLFQ